MTTPTIKLPTVPHEQFVWPDKNSMMIIISDGKEKKRFDVVTSECLYNKPWRFGNDYEADPGLKNPHPVFYRALSSRAELEAYIEIMADTLDIYRRDGRRDLSLKFFDNDMTDIRDFTPEGMRGKLFKNNSWTKEVFETLEDRQPYSGIIPFQDADNSASKALNLFWETTIANAVHCCDTLLEQYMDKTLVVIAPDPSSDQKEYAVRMTKAQSPSIQVNNKEHVVYSCPNRENLETNQKIKRLVEESRGKSAFDLANELFKMVK